LSVLDWNLFQLTKGALRSHSRRKEAKWGAVWEFLLSGRRNLPMSDVTNPFDGKSIAERYQKGRPFFHPLVISRIRQRLDVTQKVERALDIGCGTGMSSRALLEIAESVDAIDASRWMVEAAPPHPRITYRYMKAEEIQYRDATFDLITLSQVLHWTNADAVFPRVYRVAKQDSFVAIYDDFWLWDTPIHSAEVNWFQQRFQPRFPAPPRNTQILTSHGKFVPRGFIFEAYEEYTHPERLTRNEFIDYLTTQSTVTTAIHACGQSLESAVVWLMSEMDTIFGTAATHEFSFGGHIYYLRRT
jgi:ubiquinone/menaquinone biosynthesis C-methylase UbiE